MFYVRQTPWHGMGVRVEEALASEEALRISGLDWSVRQAPVYYGEGRALTEEYRANLRERYRRPAGHRERPVPNRPECGSLRLH